MCQDEQLRRRRSHGVNNIIHDNTNNDYEKEEMNNDNNNDQPMGYTLTRRVVSYHKHANDGWVIYQGGVYDVTLFLDTHPGGAAILTEHLGSDISKVFHDDGTHAHSSYARKMLEKHRIGTLSDDATTTPISTNTSTTGEEQTTSSVIPKVDWNKPILHQVGMLGHDYHRWIHSFPTTDDTVKMFTNSTLEALTKCPWYVPLLFWVPIILFECVHYVILMNGVTQLRPTPVLSMIVTGYLSWLWFEYALHRWVFHWRSTSYSGNIIHFLIHGHHHITPMDFDRLVFPPAPAMLLAWPFWLGAPKLLGVEHGYPWLVGFAVGYLIYDMTHFWIHHGIPANRLLKQQKRRHVHHHYFQPYVNFGISNPLFDYVLGTIKEPAQV